MKTILHGVVKGVYLGLYADSLVTTPVSEAQVTFEGFAGDKHAGWTRLSDNRTPFYERGTLIRNDRQISIVSLEELAQVAAALGVDEIQPEWLGANLCLSAVPALTRLPPATRIFFSHGVVLIVSGENLPCRGAGTVIQSYFPTQENLASRFVTAARGLRGLVAVVERTGTVSKDETVQIESPPQYVYRT